MVTWKSSVLRLGRGRLVRSFALTRAFSSRPQLQEWDSIVEHEIEGSSFYEADLTSLRSYPIKSSQFKFPNRKKQLSLAEFLDELPKTLKTRLETLKENPSALKGKEDPVLSLFRYDFTCLLPLYSAVLCVFPHFLFPIFIQKNETQCGGLGSICTL